MKTLYISQQGCYVCLQQELVVVKKKEEILAEVQLPLLEQILIFGKSQVTTQVIRACIHQDIPIVYLSRMGYCYGRIIPIERGYRQLFRYQQLLELGDRLTIARKIVKAKIRNSRVILQRQARKQDSESVKLAVSTLDYLSQQAETASNHERLMGFEGASAASYFSALGECLTNDDFVFMARSRRPPLNPVNAMLSFGYQVLWNHLLALIEIQGLDPYQGCLHEGSYRHAALASDLIEEFRAPIIDSLTLYLVNKKVINSEDFAYHDGGCFLNDSGRKKYLGALVQRMEEEITIESGEKEPRWALLSQQVKKFQDFVYAPVNSYQPYLIK
jgi:CRISP-associated protein Cas1